MKKLYVILVISLLGANAIFAQAAHFTTNGSIEYEKSVNMFAVIKNLYGKEMEGFVQTSYDEYKKTRPQFKVLKSTLTFSGDKTLFTPIVPETAPVQDGFNLPMTDQNSIVYSDIAMQTVTVQRNVFEQSFLVKDSLRKTKWKITDETREIAGYQCRRANGITLDSVYVVAFFTEKIPVSGGPESFSGLPGMILEVALPHENIIWRATKVNDMTIAPAYITPPKKGKPVNDKQLNDILLSNLKNQGDPAQINFVVKQYIF